MKLLREYQGKYQIKNPSNVGKYLKEFLDEDREYLICIGLDNQLNVMYKEIVAIGTGEEIHSTPREIFRGAILRGAVNIIVAHNHPSNSSEFSELDLETRDRLRESGKLLNIKLIDFILIYRDLETKKPNFKSAFVTEGD